MQGEHGTDWYGVPRRATSWAGVTQCVARWIDHISTAAGSVAAVLTAALAVLTLALVIARYCFDWNHTGWEEFKWHCFGAAVLLGGALCLARDGHVRMDLIYGRLPPRARAAIDLVAMLVVVLPFCLIVVHYGTSGALDSLERGEVSRNAGGLPYRWIPRSFIPFGFAVLALQAIAVAMRAVVVIIGGTKTDGDGDGDGDDDGADSKESAT